LPYYLYYLRFAFASCLIWKWNKVDRMIQQDMRPEQAPARLPAKHTEEATERINYLLLPQQHKDHTIIFGSGQKSA
jgi:hypothetical protein